MTPVYLDHNASSPLHPAARAAMLEVLDLPANAHSAHRAGQHAHEAVEAARRTLAGVLDVDPTRIVFTSGATEANALALHDRGPWCASAVEHPSVLVWASATLPVDGAGQVVLDTAAVHPGYAVMLANNETGVIQPIAAVRAWTAARGARLHVDATQGLGRMALPAGLFDADTVALSAHKFGGPQGVGALVVRGPTAAPMLRGGPQERGRRAGTVNVVGVVGMAAAAAASVGAHAALAPLQEALEGGVVALGGRVIGAAAPRLANTTCVQFHGVDASDLVMALDLGGVQASAGAACASGSTERSHVLRAMGIPGSALRLSTGPSTTRADITAALNALTGALKQMERA